MTCTWPTCKEPEHKQGYCFLHFKTYGTKEEKKPAKKIANLSPKRKELQKEYVKLVKKMLAENDRCEIKIQGVCRGKATGMHHIKKRTAKNLTDRTNLLRCCNACNGWIERNPLEAIELGVSKSKHIPSPIGK